MKISTGHSVQTNAVAAVHEAWLQAGEGAAGEPVLLICHASADYTADKLRDTLCLIVPRGCKVVGSSSCLGAMNEKGFHSKDGLGLSLIVFSEDAGDFGEALCDQGDKPFAAAAKATQQAILDAGRPGELPDLIWMSAAPGQEEELLEGIASVVGTHVPVVGGSSADNDISGGWWEFSQKICLSNGVLIIVFYPECAVGLSFHSGYAPTQYSGVVTKAEGRVVYTIDDKPAAEIYNDWTNGLVTQKLQGGNILQDSTFSPLGVEAGRIEGVPYYAMKHPELILADGAMELFSNLAVGEELTLMEGSKDSLTQRAGSVISGLRVRESWSKDQVAGALVVYCAGCMLGVHQHMNVVQQSICSSLGSSPFQGVFTFGEQGCFIDGVNRHGNLMISVVVFVNV